MPSRLKSHAAGLTVENYAPREVLLRWTLISLAWGGALEGHLDELLRQLAAAITNRLGARRLVYLAFGLMSFGIGVAALFWAVVKVMGHIESALNHIWKVPSRSWERRLGDYLAIMLIGPLLLITASSATVYLQTQVTAMADRLDLLRMVGPVISLAFNLAPYLLIWLLFSAIMHARLVTGWRGRKAAWRRHSIWARSSRPRAPTCSRWSRSRRC